MIHSFWSDFFNVVEPTPTKQRLYTSTQTPSASSVYILSCLFNGCTSGSNGGALYCTSVTYLLVESSSFFSCTTSSRYGGAINFQNTNSGQCVLHKVCGYDCYSTNTASRSDGQFSNTAVKNDASSKNYVNYSSIVRCVTTRSNSFFMMYCSNGKIFWPAVNMSNNRCLYFSVNRCNPFHRFEFCYMFIIVLLLRRQHCFIYQP